MIEIDSLYNQLVHLPSDINEHLPTLKEYSEKCDTITEFGVRGVVSTVALIKGNPKKMISVDLFHPSYWNKTNELNKVIDYAKDKNIDYKFIIGDTRLIKIEETDMLFIDTLHTYTQLKIELKKHGNKVKKFLIFHDTTLYENIDEPHSYTSEIIVGDKKGLWPAIDEFLSENKEWKLFEKKINNNGLTILKRN